MAEKSNLFGTGPIDSALFATRDAERWGRQRMLTAEYYAFLRKAEEYDQKAEEEADPLTKKALEAVAREFRRRADEAQHSQSTG